MCTKLTHLLHSVQKIPISMLSTRMNFVYHVWFVNWSSERPCHTRTLINWNSQSGGSYQRKQIESFDRSRLYILCAWFYVWSVWIVDDLSSCQPFFPLSSVCVHRIHAKMEDGDIFTTPRRWRQNITKQMCKKKM